ncbi:MAG: hypothetical protein EA406_01250 [Rhodospirillales bacterium]|nr:MAG: hypothetical protein EA406_01250 [Rhodospirillales bacterium]
MEPGRVEITPAPAPPSPPRSAPPPAVRVETVERLVAQAVIRERAKPGPPIDPVRRIDPPPALPAPELHIGRVEIEVVEETTGRRHKSRGLRRPGSRGLASARPRASGTGFGPA